MPNDDIKRIQQALKEAGFNPGDIDGIWGRASIGALKRFQAKAGLEVDGIPGPKSRAALFGANAPQAPTGGASDLVWLQEALNLVGTDELPGPGSNKMIIKWAKDLDIDFPRDDVAWCGLFVAHCVGSTLTDEPLPTAPLGAQNWKHFGDSCAPKLGAVLVFWRENKSSWKGHVGFYRSEDDNAYHVIGGNQSDTVNTTRIAKHRLIAARWPKTAVALTSKIVVAAAEGDMGHKEH